MTEILDQAFTDWMATRTFLVVEDMSAARMLEASLLRGLGAKKVSAAVDGADALARIQSGTVMPDIIITDWDMPGVDGIGVLEKAKAQLPQVKVVMVTAKTDLDDVRIAASKGVDGYVAKPFTKETLVAALRKLQAG